MKEIKDMTDDELNEAIAEFMGYERKKNLYANESGLLINFYPTHDLNQAFEVLDKWHKLSTCNVSHAIYRNGEKYLVTLDSYPEMVAQVKHANLAHAICEAVLQAVRG